jgi:hypothetical protein
MAEAKKKLPTITSPRATFRFPKLTEPDYGNNDYPNPDGVYSVQLVFKADSAEAKELIAELTPHYVEAQEMAEKEFAALKKQTREAFKKKNITGPQFNALFTELYDKETEEPTGEIAFKINMKASGTYKKGPKEGKKWERKPVIFDARGQRMTKLPAIWGGTVGKVNFEVQPYFVPGTAAAGLSLKLQGVQIIDLVSAGGATAEAMGFGAEEGGYVHDDSAFADEPPTGSAGGDSAADDGAGGDF